MEPDVTHIWQICWQIQAVKKPAASAGSGGGGEKAKVRFGQRGEGFAAATKSTKWYKVYSIV